jgi:hypothetical protein
MVASSTELNPRDVDRMDRAELIGKLLKFKDCIRTEFTSQWIDRQSTHQLRILLLAAQLYRVLLHYPRRPGPESQPPLGCEADKPTFNNLN